MAFHFDTNIIFIPLVLILLLIWLVDKAFLKQRQKKGKGNENKLVQVAYEYWPLFFILICFKSFAFESQFIPSSSMEPTLYTGDYIVVSKSTYGFKLPLTNHTLLKNGTPKRGDVAVFRYPNNPKQYFIKRVIGTPGDTIIYNEGQLIINGNNVDKQQLDKQQHDKQQLAPYRLSQLNNQELKHLDFYENKINNKTFTTQDVKNFNMLNPQSWLNKQGEITQQPPFVYKNADVPLAYIGKYWKISVPEGQYFVMGDNRDNSADSRIWGFVPESHLQGKALYVWMHKPKGWYMPSFSNMRKIN